MWEYIGSIQKDNVELLLHNVLKVEYNIWGKIHSKMFSIWEMLVNKPILNKSK